MGFPQHIRLFHMHSSHVINVKKSAVVYLFRSNTPVGEPPHLIVEESVQQVEARRIVLDPIKYPDIIIKEVLYFGTFIAEKLETPLHNLLFSMAFNYSSL